MNVQHSLTTKDIFYHASIITLKIAHFILINMPTKKLFFPRINAIPASPNAANKIYIEIGPNNTSKLLRRDVWTFTSSRVFKKRPRHVS